MRVVVVTCGEGLQLIVTQPPAGVKGWLDSE